jgi:hypothetical protein
MRDSAQALQRGQCNRSRIFFSKAIRLPVVAKHDEVAQTEANSQIPSITVFIELNDAQLPVNSCDFFELPSKSCSTCQEVHHSVVFGLPSARSLCTGQSDFTKFL